MTNPNHNIAAHIARTVCAMIIAVSASMSVASAAKSADVIDLSSASTVSLAYITVRKSV